MAVKGHPGHQAPFTGGPPLNQALSTGAPCSPTGGIFPEPDTTTRGDRHHRSRTACLAKPPAILPALPPADGVGKPGAPRLTVRVRVVSRSGRTTGGTLGHIDRQVTTPAYFTPPGHALLLLSGKTRCVVSRHKSCQPSQGPARWGRLVVRQEAQQPWTRLSGCESHLVGRVPRLRKTGGRRCSVRHASRSQGGVCGSSRQSQVPPCPMAVPTMSPSSCCISSRPFLGVSSTGPSLCFGRWIAASS
ncbi:hypothetical protein B0T11DRAFT_82261 [Plectosphaerella cucumerina]|uniref:Uncharacterized protein n=1 Tax=Plectosphaerella cucumerina TaxID=40658 RepID=A0A8K0TE69_9PEZI|nr:hypothetical protein B0T11DRAFT_82261 [Plectosphaerella cucumerina]